MGRSVGFKGRSVGFAIQRNVVTDLQSGEGAFMLWAFIRPDAGLHCFLRRSIDPALQIHLVL